MSYTPPQYADTPAQAILALASVVADSDKTDLGDGTVNGALDVLADVLAETDVQVPQTNAGAILALAQYAHGGGGGGSSTVTLDIMEVLSGTTLSTAYFTVEDSSGAQLTITPVTESDSEGEFHYFTVTANAGELLTFRTVDGSGYYFASNNTKYVMSGEGQTTLPLDFSREEVQIVAANIPSAIAHTYLTLELSTVQ